MSNNIIYRPAVESDLPAIIASYDEIIAEEEAGKIKIGWKRGVYPTDASTRALLERGELYVIEDGTDLAASFVMNREHSSAWDELTFTTSENFLVLHTPVVPRAMGGRGFGRAIVEYFEDFAAANSFDALRTDTNADNIPMRRLYAKLGFREVGAVECTYNGIEGIRLVALEKALENPFEIGRLS